MWYIGEVTWNSIQASLATHNQLNAQYNALYNLSSASAFLGGIPCNYIHKRSFKAAAVSKFSTLLASGAFDSSCVLESNAPQSSQCWPAEDAPPRRNPGSRCVWEKRLQAIQELTAAHPPPLQDTVLCVYVLWHFDCPDWCHLRCVRSVNAEWHRHVTPLNGSVIIEWRFLRLR